MFNLFCYMAATEIPLKNIYKNISENFSCLTIYSLVTDGQTDSVVLVKWSRFTLKNT